MAMGSVDADVDHAPAAIAAPETVQLAARARYVPGDVPAVAAVRRPRVGDAFDAGVVAHFTLGRPAAGIGRALLDLAADREPCAEDMPGLRRAMRALLLHHLGGRGLKSWELIAALPRGVPVAAQTGDAVSSDSAGDDASVS